jgi:hypothetical protein
MSAIGGKPLARCGTKASCRLDIRRSLGCPGCAPGNPQRVTRDRQDHGLEVPVADQRAPGHGHERIALGQRSASR